MKYIDKFLKFLKTDRNTFLTYILSLATVYIVVDRIVEMIFMGFTGVGSSYWGPIQYTLALACPVFAFCFSFASKFVKGSNMKISFFYVYCISLYIIALSMFVQWLNTGAWVLLMYVPNFTGIVAEFSDLIQPAFTALAIYLPIATFYPIFKWLFFGVNDTKKWLDKYFAKEKPTIFELPLLPIGTSFRKLVWEYLCKIPYGNLTTYGDIARDIAKLLNKPKMSSQAVGNAISNNPISIIVPCHRVIGSNHTLKGYSAGVDIKKQLLILEGHDISNFK